MNYLNIQEKLEQGETVTLKSSGNSMTPRIKSGDKVVIQPATVDDVGKKDAVFCKVNGSFYVHLVYKKSNDGRVLIGNNHGHENGWTDKVFGKVTEVFK